MKDTTLQESLTSHVTPRALKNYAQALGWLPVPEINGTIAVYRQPESELHQVIVPLDESFDDYGDSVAEAIRKLAAYERQRPSEVLNHLLLPPADLLRFQEISPDTEANTLPLDHAVNMIDGVRRSLLSVAHSILRPQPYHPRLSRGEAEQFVQRCQFGQTARGSFTIRIACPLDATPNLQQADQPFGRKVSEGLIGLVADIARAADAGDADRLTDTSEHPLLSANLCEALLLLRPSGDRSKLRLGVGWSKAIPRPTAVLDAPIEYRRETFEAIEYLGPRLRAAAEPKDETFVGFVDSLKGQPDPERRMFGEATFSVVLENQESLRARADLTPDEYKIAGDAHLDNDPVYFRGTLIRGPRLNRIERLAGFRRISPQDTASSS